MSVSISKCQACDLGTSDEVKSPSELAYHQQDVDLLITDIVALALVQDAMINLSGVRSSDFITSG